MIDVRGFGDCGCGGGSGGSLASAFGQLDPAAMAAVTTGDAPPTSAEPYPFFRLFLVSVAAGVTVYLITRMLPHRR